MVLRLQMVLPKECMRAGALREQIPAVNRRLSAERLVLKLVQIRSLRLKSRVFVTDRLLE